MASAVMAMVTAFSMATGTAVLELDLKRNGPAPGNF
jgi:hypothetical protein